VAATLPNTGGQGDRRLVEGRRLPEERQAKTDTQLDRCLMCGLWYDDSAFGCTNGNREHQNNKVRASLCS